MTKVLSFGTDEGEYKEREEILAEARKAINENDGDITILLYGDFIIEIEDGEVFASGEYEGLNDYSNYYEVFRGTKYEELCKEEGEEEGREDYKDEIRNDHFFTGVREF